MLQIQNEEMIRKREEAERAIDEVLNDGQIDDVTDRSQILQRRDDCNPNSFTRYDGQTAFEPQRYVGVKEQRRIVAEKLNEDQKKLEESQRDLNQLDNTRREQNRPVQVDHMRRGRDVRMLRGQNDNSSRGRRDHEKEMERKREERRQRQQKPY